MLLSMKYQLCIHMRLLRNEPIGLKVPFIKTKYIYTIMY